MNSKFGSRRSVGGGAIVVAACEQRRRNHRAGRRGARAQRRPRQRRRPRAARRAAPLGRAAQRRDHAVDSYGSGGGETGAFQKALGAIKAANPDLKVTVFDAEFNDLFKKCEHRGRHRRRPRPVHRPERQPRQGGPRGPSSPTSRARSTASSSDFARSRSTAARSTASCTWSPSPSRPSPCTTTRARSRRRRPPPTSCSPASRTARSRSASRQDSVVPLVRVGRRVRRQAHGRHRQVRRRHGRRRRRLQVLPGPQGRRRQVLQGRTTSSTDFKSGKINVIVDGPWQRLTSRTPSRTTLAVAPMPRRNRAPRTRSTGADGWYINANSREPRPRDGARPRDVVQGRASRSCRHAGHIPADTTRHDHRPDRPEFADAVRRPASRARRRRSSTTSGPTSTTP